MISKRLISVLLTTVALSALPFGIVVAKEETKLSNTQSNQSNSPKISEDKVREILNIIDKANEDRNIDEIIKYLAPFVYAEITVKTDDRSFTIKLNGIEEHRRYLEEQLKQVKSSETLKKYYQIRLSPDEQIAFVNTTKLSSITTTDGKRMLVDSDGEARLAFVDGKLQIISWNQTSEVDRRP